MKGKRIKITVLPKIVLLVAVITVLQRTERVESRKTTRTTPKEFPPPPYAHGCRMLFSELKLFPCLGSEQFIELFRVCDSEPTHDSSFAMSNYRILIIDQEGNIVVMCKLNGIAKREGNERFYTIGGASMLEKDFSFDQCQVTPEFDAKSDARVQIGAAAPVAVVLLFNNKPELLDKFELVKDKEGVYGKRKLFQKTMDQVMSYTQDMYVISSSSPFIACKRYGEIYSGYAPDPLNVASLREWWDDEAESEHSLSRCGSRLSNLHSNLKLPFQPELWVEAEKSPGKPNKCETGVRFVVEEMLPSLENPRIEDSSGCLIITDDPLAIPGGSVTDLKTYAKMRRKAFDRAEQCHFLVLPRPLSYDLVGDKNTGETTIANIPDVAEEIDVEEEEERAVISNLKVIGPETPSWQSCEDASFISTLKQLKLYYTKTFTDVISRKDVCYWFEWLPEQKFRCRLCQKMWKDNLFPVTKGSKLLTLMITSMQGQPLRKKRSNYDNKMLIENHLKNPLHDIAVDYFSLVEGGLVGEELLKQFHRPGGPFRRFVQATENIVVAGTYSTKFNIPFYKFLNVTNLIKYYGVDMGHLFANDDGHRKITMSVSESAHRDLLERLKKENPKLGISVDTSTDVGSLSSMTITFQTFDDIRDTKVYLYKILEVEDGETTEQLFDQFIRQLEVDGVTEFIRKNTVGATTDGASNMKLFREKLNAFTDSELLSIHCMAHRWERVLKTAWKKICPINLVEVTNNKSYRMLYSHAPKKNKILRDTATSLGDQKFTLKRIKDIRWVNSKGRALRTLLAHWRTVVIALQNIQKDKSFAKKDRDNVQELEKNLINPVFLSHLSFVIDVCDELSSISLDLQLQGTTLIGKKESRERFKAAVVRMKTNPGPKEAELLASTKVKGTESTSPISMKDFETKQVVLQDIELLTNPQTRQYLHSSRECYLDAILSRIDHYFPDDVTDHYEILNPLKWPKNSEAFGGQQLKKMNSQLKWGFNDADLLREWDLLRESIQQNEAFDEKKKGKPEEFWSHFLKQPVKWSTSMRKIVTDVLSVSASSSEVERMYSIYTATKTYRRYSLDISRVDAIVRLKYNIPDDPKEFPSVQYTMDYLSKYIRADDDTRAPKRKGTAIPRCSKRKKLAEESYESGDSCEQKSEEDVGEIEDSSDEVDSEIIEDDDLPDFLPWSEDMEDIMEEQDLVAFCENDEMDQTDTCLV